MNDPNKPVAYAIKDSVGCIIHVEHMPGNAVLLAHGREIVSLFAQPTPVFTPQEYAAIREAVTFFLNEWSTQKELMYEESHTCATLSALLDRFRVKPIAKEVNDE
jgi:hypothetical protein